MREVKRLYRVEREAKLAGVCGGIGEYFNMDPTVIRLIWVILTICGVGSGLLVYIIAAIIMPEN